MTLFLDALFFGSCNAEHLSAFKQVPDFASFKGRTELVQMPYLVDYEMETLIYQELLETLNHNLYIGPHVSDVVALWAVLCRLERPAGYREHDKPVQEALNQMTPMEKANYYAHGSIPAGVSREVAAHLRAQLPAVYEERKSSEGYEVVSGPAPANSKACC